MTGAKAPVILRIARLAIGPKDLAIAARHPERPSPDRRGAKDLASAVTRSFGRTGLGRRALRMTT